MKVVFLYGPPAVGKLTVALALAQLTDFKVLHNHLIVNPVAALFGFGSERGRRLGMTIRLMLLEEAAQAGLSGVILTYVYAASRLSDIHRVVEVVERYSGQVCFVRLTCDPATLEAHVDTLSREKYGKIVTVERLREKLVELDDPFGSLSNEVSLTIDTSVLRPDETASRIVAHYNLQAHYL